MTTKGYTDIVLANSSRLKTKQFEEKNQKFHFYCNETKKFNNFADQFNDNAQMAELVDALVSNTCDFTVVPVRPRLWVQKSGSS